MGKFYIRDLVCWSLCNHFLYGKLCSPVNYILYYITWRYLWPNKCLGWIQYRNKFIHIMSFTGLLLHLNENEQEDCVPTTKWLHLHGQQWSFSQLTSTAKTNADPPRLSHPLAHPQVMLIPLHSEVSFHPPHPREAFFPLAASLRKGGRVGRMEGGWVGVRWEGGS